MGREEPFSNVKNEKIIKNPTKRTETYSKGL
jgi:hypothetical protein